MKYIYLSGNIVAEIIPEIDENFPEFTINQRYSANFLKTCIKVDDPTEVSIGMIYENGIFKQYIPPDIPPAPPEPPLSEVDLEQLALDHEYRLSMLEIGI